MKSEILTALLLSGTMLVGAACAESLESGARSAMSQILSARYIRCGESYFNAHWNNGWLEGFFTTREGRSIYEYRGLRIELDPDNMTEADRLNGIQWSGWAILTCTAYRQFTWPSDAASGRWSEWRNCTDLGSFHGFKAAYMDSLVKRQGEPWLVSDLGKQRRVTIQDYVSNFRFVGNRLTCPEIPK